MTSDAVAVSKARKILKRTLVGSSLIAFVAALLWWNSTDSEGTPIFFASVIVLFATVFEVGRMGALARMQLLPALLVAALLDSMLAAPAGGGFARTVDGCIPLPTIPNLQWMLFVIGCIVAVAGYATTRIALRLTRSPWVAGTSTLIAGAAVSFAIVQDWPNGFGLAFAAAVALVLAAFASREQGGLARVAIAAGLGTWIIAPLLLVWSVWFTWHTTGLVALLVLSKFGDTCGYYVGSTLGKTHPFPKISPGKTVAGCVGSFVGVTAMSGILWLVHVVPDGRFGLLGALAAGATLNIAAQAGDLLKSWTKRRAGVKDSSTIFGPAGGLLDQVDSLLLTVPMSLATWPFLFA
jgi:phosphatidate cytidylyltransferase